MGVTDNCRSAFRCTRHCGRKHWIQDRDRTFKVFPFLPESRFRFNSFLPSISLVLYPHPLRHPRRHYLLLPRRLRSPRPHHQSSRNPPLPPPLPVRMLRRVNSDSQMKNPEQWRQRQWQRQWKTLPLPRKYRYCTRRWMTRLCSLPSLPLFIRWRWPPLLRNPHRLQALRGLPPLPLFRIGMSCLPNRPDQIPTRVSNSIHQIQFNSIKIFPICSEKKKEKRKNLIVIYLTLLAL